MIINDALANSARAAHDVGLAAWLGGAMFGKFAHNPSLARISDHEERGAVATTAWNGYNVVNALGLGAAVVGWTAARVTETRPANLSSREQKLSFVKDGLMAVAVVTAVANGVQGARLAKQAPDGRVAVETGTKPAEDTPPKVAKIQRTLGTLGNLNVVSGVGLVAVNGVLAQINHDHPAPQRVLPTGSGVSPLWIATATATLVAAADQVRRGRG